MTVAAQELLLARAAHWEANAPDKVFMTQPHSGGQTTDYTWRQTLDEARRMATHLIGLKLRRPSQIAIVGKNSAHWIMADLAIWMAGHVSVPLYPTMASENVGQILAHSESRLLFEGKQFLGSQTNNWAEYEAVALALHDAKARGLAGREIEVRMDSKLVVEQILGNWKIKEPTLKPQVAKVRALLGDFSKYHFVHVPREDNAEADRLVNEAIDEAL